MQETQIKMVTPKLPSFEERQSKTILDYVLFQTLSQDQIKAISKKKYEEMRREIKYMMTTSQEDNTMQVKIADFRKAVEEAKTKNENKFVFNDLTFGTGYADNILIYLTKELKMKEKEMMTLIDNPKPEERK